MPRSPSPKSIDFHVSRRITRSPRGSVFSAATFASLGSRDAIDHALSRLAKEGKIRRLSRGLYDKPRQDPDFGPLWPTPQSLIDAIQKQHRIRIQPTGQYAANLLGLSEQVPAKIELLANIGKSRVIRAGPMRITLKATSPRNVAAANSLTGLIIQALKSLGPHHITRARIAHLQTTLPASERRKLLFRLHLAPTWMQPFLRTIATNKADARKRKKA
jgi:hypothetical protein